MKTVCWLLILCCSLWGCKSTRVFDDPKPLPTGIENTSDEAINYIYNKLISEHVKIIAMGDNYLLSIPANYLFHNQSPELTSESYKIMDDVVTYLQSMRKILLKVSAHSDCYQSPARTMALTKARAKTVGRYLWSRNVEASIVFTEGAGNGKPIVAKRTGLDSSPNSRIEITFRRVET